MTTEGATSLVVSHLPTFRIWYLNKVYGALSYTQETFLHCYNGLSCCSNHSWNKSYVCTTAKKFCWNGWKRTPGKTWSDDNCPWRWRFCETRFHSVWWSCGEICVWQDIADCETLRFGFLRGIYIQMHLPAFDRHFYNQIWRVFLVVKSGSFTGGMLLRRGWDTAGQHGWPTYAFHPVGTKRIMTKIISCW